MGGVTMEVTGNFNHEILYDLKRQHVVGFVSMFLHFVFNAPELSWNSQDHHVAHFQIHFWRVADAYSHKHSAS